MAGDEIEVWNPSGTTAEHAAGAELAFPRRARGAALRVAFLDNVKPNTADLYRMVESGLAERYAVTATFHAKELGAQPAAPEILAAIAGEAEVAIVGTAD